MVLKCKIYASHDVYNTDFIEINQKFIFFLKFTHLSISYRCVISFQAALLEEDMKDLRRVLRPGAKRLNWNSLGINDFVSKCDSVNWQDLHDMM